MTKVAFFGTSDRSTPILEALKTNFDLVLCVTKEDVLVGRHREPKEVEVKRWAKANGVKFVTIAKSLKEEKEKIIEQIKSSKAEVGVVADFGFIIPQEILAVFPKGLINIHFSLLPKYRGASPVQFAILNDDSQTGITYQLMEFTLDTGPIIFQLPYPLAGTETSGQLYQTLFKPAAQQLPVVLQKYLDGKLTPQKQDETQASYTHSPSHQKNTYIYKEDAKINWNAPVEKIDAGVRAYNPWPIAWTTLGNMQSARTKIVGFTQLKDPRNASKIVKIYTTQLALDGRIGILQLQPESGKILHWQEFCNGFLIK